MEEIQVPIDPKIKLNILKDELRLWQNTHYMASVRARVGVASGNKEYELQALRDLEGAIKAMDVVNNEIDKVQADLMAAGVKL